MSEGEWLYEFQCSHVSCAIKQFLKERFRAKPDYLEEERFPRRYSLV